MPEEVNISWESIPTDSQLAIEPGAGVRLTFTCTTHQSQLKNKAAILDAIDDMVGYSTDLRDRWERFIDDLHAVEPGSPEADEIIARLQGVAERRRG